MDMKNLKSVRYLNRQYKMDSTQLILDALETMRKGDVARGEKFSAIAYAKAIKGIKDLKKPIVSVEDVAGVAGIGKKITAKIDEILKTGKLAAAERTKQEINLDIYDALLKVHGIGPVKARELVNTHSIKSIAELREKQGDLLNEVQKMGLKYYEDLLERIPRAEMIEHNELLQSHLPKKAHAVVVGSFRREAETSGDIDMLLAFPPDVSGSKQKKRFDEFVEVLKTEGYIKDVLAKGTKKCMAVVQLPGKKARRLDLLLTPHDEYAYSILYFTGSDKFNVAFRKHALTKGYTLNEHTMKPLKEDTPCAPPMSTEEDIFQFLGLQFVEPKNRKGEENVRAVDA
jgi:DNA polymerase beta